MAASANLKLALFGTVSPVLTPGTGTGQKGIQVNLDFTANGNNAMVHDTVPADASNHFYDLDASVSGTGFDDIITAGETIVAPAKGYLIVAGLVSSSGTSTGYADVDDGLTTRRLYNGGVLLCVKGGGNSITESFDITFDAVAQGHGNLKVDVFAIY